MCIEIFVGEVCPGVFSMWVHLFLTLSILAVDTDGTRANGSRGMM
jgi:hypothetical protein